MLVQVSPTAGPAGLVEPWFENWCCFSFSFVLNSAPQKPHWKPSQAWQTSCSPAGANILTKKFVRLSFEDRRAHLLNSADFLQRLSRIFHLRRQFCGVGPRVLPIKAKPPRFLVTRWEAANGRQHSSPHTLASCSSIEKWPLCWMHLCNFHPPFQGASAPIGGTV